MVFFHTLWFLVHEEKGVDEHYACDLFLKFDEGHITWLTIFFNILTFLRNCNLASTLALRLGGAAEQLSSLCFQKRPAPSGPMVVTSPPQPIALPLRSAGRRRAGPVCRSRFLEQVLLSSINGFCTRKSGHKRSECLTAFSFPAIPHLSDASARIFEHEVLISNLDFGFTLRKISYWFMY